MANKLNAFLASVPANAVATPVRPPIPPPQPSGTASLPTLQTSFPDFHTEVSAPVTPLPRSHAAQPQPTTPQPQQRGRAQTAGNINNNNRRAKKFETHFHKSESARSLSTPVAVDKDVDDADTGNSTVATSPHEPQKPFISPLKAFNPTQRSGSSAGSKPPTSPTSPTALQQQQHQASDSEAGPLRRLSLQGSHHRRVSTDTTMFNRYLRQQADRDINTDVVQHFETIPVATLSRPASIDEADSLVIDPLDVLAVFERGELLSTASALELLKLATNVMTLDANLLALQAPYTLVGDLHGQFQDLLTLFRVHGAPSATNPFLFLGDYVDRGTASCEIVLLLLAFKIALPNSVHLLRGNHECRSLSTFYGFRTECRHKYGTLVYNRMIKCFESMPLAATLATSFGTFLAVHGGLSPAIQRLDDINDCVNRFMEPEPTGALCDLLWADPAKDASDQLDDWLPNSVRGCSYTFNEAACRAFLKANELLAIIRAHELEEDGFREHFRHSDAIAADAADDSEAQAAVESALSLPPVITVFSAPEYCNTNHNMGATLVIHWERRSTVLEYRQHKRSTQKEHVCLTTSEDDAVTNFLRDALPFLPVDFYELIAHCRQLKQMLTLSKQMSLSQLAVGGANGSASPSASGAITTDAGAIAADAGAIAKDAAGLNTVKSDAANASVPLASDAVTAAAGSSVGNKDTTDGPDARRTFSSMQLTTTDEVASIESTDASNSRSLRASRRKQQQQLQSRQETAEPRDATPTLLTTATAAAPPTTADTLGNVHVLTHNGAAARKTSSATPAPRSSWCVCPGFLRFWHRVFGSTPVTTTAATTTRSTTLSTTATAAPTGVYTSMSNDSIDNHNDDTSAMPMNNQSNSSDGYGSPTVSPLAAIATADLTTTTHTNSAATVTPLPLMLPTEPPMQLESMFPGGHRPKGADVFTASVWRALKLYFTLLDVSGNGVLLEESFVVLLAEQDSDAYATEDELTLLMEVIDTNADGLITEQDFLLFAYRSYLRWKKKSATTVSPTTTTKALA